ncbi:MAG: hypothetical protein JO257_38200 [Deltaproteobacteria bacterium]|nr:hypothetical protein [Deltaproteobacteria bacterium]
MKFMLMMQAPRGSGDWAVMSWPPKAIQGHIAYMKTLYNDLKSAGQLVDAQGLAPPADARIVRANDSGKPEVTDGPFAEAKEFLAGYWIVDVASKDEAYAIAARASMAPGKDGQPLHLPIEIRQVMAAPEV